MRRLEWRRTYPGIGQDYCTDQWSDEPRVCLCFARVYYSVQVPTEEKWFWTASRRQHIASGHAMTAEEAIRLAEDALLGPATPNDSDSGPG